MQQNMLLRLATNTVHFQWQEVQVNDDETGAVDLTSSVVEITCEEKECEEESTTVCHLLQCPSHDAHWTTVTHQVCNWLHSLHRVKVSQWVDTRSADMHIREWMQHHLMVDASKHTVLSELDMVRMCMGGFTHAQGRQALKRVGLEVQEKGEIDEYVGTLRLLLLDGFCSLVD